MQRRVVCVESFYTIGDSQQRRFLLVDDLIVQQQLQQVARHLG